MTTGYAVHHPQLNMSSTTLDLSSCVRSYPVAIAPGSDLSRVTRVARQLPGGGERRNLHAQAHQSASVLDEVVRVRLSVALDVRPAGVLRIGPPVVALRKKVVRAARAARTVRGRYRGGLLGQVLIRRLQHARAVERRHGER